ncbi:MAG: sugar phosphate isomerase/epimerase family protein [Faecousia sp.]
MNFYLSTIDERAHLLARQYGMGIEIAHFCTPWCLDEEFPQTDALVRGMLGCSDRFTLHAPFSELFPCAVDPKVRAVAAERYRQVIQVARGYGISKIVVHGGYNPHIYFPVWYKEQSVKFWKEFVSEIPENMVFCLENVLEEEPNMLTEIVSGVGDSRVRMCLDVGHANAYSKIPVMTWLEKCAPYVEHVHIHNNDGSRDSHSPLWEGTIPMGKLLTQTEERCPNATVTLELMNAEPSLQWLKREKRV